MNYLNWKEKFEVQQKNTKRTNIVLISLALLFSILICSAIYLWINDDLKFVGHTTKSTVATVVNVYWRPTRGGYVQQVTYEFEIQGERFTGYFKGTKFTGIQEIGNLLKIKYATENPAISRRVANLKKQNDN